MLRLERICAFNFLSYKELDVNLERNKVSQLIGPNGAGKTNLISAITEAAFGKNIRGYSKEQLSNRNTDIEGYALELYFSVDNDKYLAITKRTASKVTVSLKKNGKDISSHTVKDTYKTIEEIFGYSYDLFVQLIYQSSDFSMNFLEATPAIRRNFLIQLLGIDEESDTITKVSAKLNTLKATLEKHLSDSKATTSVAINVEKNLKQVKAQLDALSLEGSEDYYKDLIAEVSKDRQTEAERVASNQRIETERDNLIRSILALEATPSEVSQSEPIPPSEVSEVDMSWVNSLTASKRSATAERDSIRSAIISLSSKKPSRNCHVCNSTLDNEVAIKVHEEKIEHYQSLLAKAESQLKDIQTTLDVEQEKVNALKVKYGQYLMLRKKYENEKSAYDTAKAMVIQRETKLQHFRAKLASLPELREIDHNRLERIESQLAELHKGLKMAVTQTILMSQHMSFSLEHKALIKQLEPSLARTAELQKDIAVYSALLSALKQVLALTFEESLVLLERLTNRYLAAFSNGQFAIKFTADASTLNVTLFHNKIETKINTASKGQKTRIVISCLLAIRKLLTSMAKQPINLLVLDEVIGVLDNDGKEQLLNILAEEHDLNIYLVSHDWSHPLLSKIYVKQNRGHSEYEFE